MAQESPAPMMGSQIVDFATLPVMQNANGSRRNLFDAPTAKMANLEGHITTLKPGAAPHPPHRHDNEEMILIREGTLEVFLNGKTTELGPGSVFFVASNDLHGLRNVGTTDAVYFVLNWKVPPAK